MTQQAKPRCAGGATGVGLSSFPEGSDGPEIPTNHRALQAPRYDPRFRRQVEAVHRLGVFAIANLLEEIAAGADLRLTVTKYASLDGGLVAAYSGRDFPPPLLALDGGAP